MSWTGQPLGRQFVSGDRLTLADFSLGAALNLAEMAHYPIEPYREIRRRFAEFSTLPAWQKTLAQSALPTDTAA
jgi:glutathione S-transferase